VAILTEASLVRGRTERRTPVLSKIAFPLAVVFALVFAGTALAGKTASSSISQPIVVSSGTPTAPTSTTAPQFGDTITFDVSTTATTTPFVNLNCYQDGALVGQGWATFFAGGAPGTFGLSSPLWKSGAADCTADLGMFSKNGKWKVLASRSFHVYA
jgi:hypothetical protein